MVMEEGIKACEFYQATNTNASLKTSSVRLWAGCDDFQMEKALTASYTSRGWDPHIVKACCPISIDLHSNKTVDLTIL